jgi:hypothetical protein
VLTGLTAHVVEKVMVVVAEPVAVVHVVSEYSCCEIVMVVPLCVSV